MFYLFQKVFVVIFMLAAALYAQPDNERQGNILNNQGVAHFQKGEYEEALRSLNSSAEVFPTNPIVHRNLGSVYMEMNDLVRSEAALRTAISFKDDHALTYNHLGIVLMKAHRNKEALDMFLKAGTLEPADATILLNKGNAYIALKDFRNATAVLERARSIAPKNASIRISLGFTYGMRRKFDRAIAEARQATEIDPKNEVAQFLLGYLYAANQDRDAAIAQERTVLAMNPELGRMLYQAIHSDKILVVEPSALAPR